MVPGIKRQRANGGSHRTTLLWAAMLTGCSVSPTRPAASSGLPPGLMRLEVATSRASVHPFGLDLTSLGASFGLYKVGQASFTDAVHGWLQQQINPLIETRMVERPQSLQLATGGHTYAADFYLNGRLLLDTSLAAHELSGRMPLLLGTLPALSSAAAAAAATTWPDLDAATSAALNDMPASTTGEGATVEKMTQVYFLKGDEAQPALLMTVRSDGLPRELVVTADGVVRNEARYFDVDGSAKIFQNNINDTAGLITYPLTGLTGDGSLTSQYLQTFLPDGFTKAKEATEVFNYAANDPRFDEVMAYAHTDDHVKWMLGLGAQTYGDLPIHIELHQLPGGTPNNALFMPGDLDTGAPFQIILGDGDGSLLQNLATDRDVPSHESGHYIIYNYLKATSGESLVLHEGLADSLVFLQQNSSCLGKSICPVGSPACIEPATAAINSGCLRTSDNPWAYNDPNWQEWTAELGGKFGHKHGQVISGLLWDLNKNKTMALNDLTMMTLKAITYFQPTSGLRDFLLALLTADKELYQCKYDTAIRGFMHNRNLDVLIADVPAGCGAIPALTGNGSAAINGGGTTQTTTQTSSKKGSLLGCGAVGGNAGAPLSLLILVIGLALPLLIGRREPRRVPVKAVRAPGRGRNARTPPG